MIIVLYMLFNDWHVWFKGCFVFDKEDLLAVAEKRMPFGRYAGHRLIDLPEEYLLWFRGRGFPEGKLGELMALALEIRIEGLEYLIEPLKGKDSSHTFH